MYFSSGPTAKPPGWKAENNQRLLGRYHRSPEFKLALKEATTRLAEMLEIPKDYRLLFTPGGATGAFETALWNLLGDNVLALSWDKFSSLWAEDCRRLAKNASVRTAGPGQIADLTELPKGSDIVFVYVATTCGVVIPDEDWIPRGDNLVFADLAAAVFTHRIGWKKLDAAAFSWAKALGGEGQHGSLVLSPRAQRRLERSRRELPRLLTIPPSQDEPINTFSALAVADLHQCLDWIEELGGGMAAVARSKTNREILDNWARNKPWLADLPQSPKLRANSPVTWRFCGSSDKLARMLKLLEGDRRAYDIASHPWVENQGMGNKGFRIWCGPTITPEALRNLTERLEWAYTRSDG